MALITREYIKNNDVFKTVGVLTLDERYYKLFADDNDKPEVIKTLESKLNELVKKRGQITNDIKEVKKIKSQLIQGIVEDMESDGNDAKHKKKMSQSQKLIQEAKDKISELEDEELELPRQISKINQELLYETVKFCYNKMNTNNDDIAILDKWINEVRVKLKKNLVIKQDKESKNEMIYTQLHGIIGHEAMGLLDSLNEAK